MTCEEFRRTCETALPTNVTRGVRAAAARHYHTCPKCAAFVHEMSDKAIAEEAAELGTTPEAVLATHEAATMDRKIEDMRDSEYRQTVSPTGEFWVDPVCGCIRPADVSREIVCPYHRGKPAH